MTYDDIKPNSLTAAIKSVKPSDDKIELVVRLANTATRALHYIADVRSTRYDPQTRTLRLSTSDEGREVIPGAISKLPVFRRIDPESDAEIRFRIPARIIKLSRNAPPGELAFETHQLSEVQEVVVEIAWADVPYYKDTRVTDDMRLPAARWEQHKARATKRMNPGRRSKGQQPVRE